MSTFTISRPPRQPGPAVPQGQLELQEPPALVESAPLSLSSMATFLPMGLMAGAMALMYVGNGTGPVSYISSGMMGTAMAGMMLGQVGRQGSERRRRMRRERRDYLRYLAQVRRQAGLAMEAQRRAVYWNRPDPAALWSLALGPRLWERRPGHEDFAEVRVGIGSQRAGLRLVPPQTKPVEDLEPLCASALRRFIRAHGAVPGVPTAVHLRGFPSVALTGDPDPVRGLARALVAQLAAFHAPEDLRIAVLAGPRQALHWDWTKWLPHVGHPTVLDAAGPVRLYSDELDELLALLGPAFADRPGFDPDAVPGPVEPYLVVVCDGPRLPPESRLLSGGVRNVVLLDVAPADGDGPYALRVEVSADHAESVTDDGPVRLGRPDSLSVGRCAALARLMSPLRTGGAVDSAQPLHHDIEMTRLLGIRDVHTYDVHALWRSRARMGRLRVPIGVDEHGAVVELDIKESAQGGMGPHGVLIGATGSGKSELLRTLVITLAAVHSSDQLNFVLVDFKGGATFLGLDGLPHTSALITNLADELPLVDRMQAALHGELVRRQEVLRQNSFSSLLEYDRARAKALAGSHSDRLHETRGAPLPALPTLFIVVDEFSELLATKPEFMELFVMIGRLGRSLGVHLLLASQRLDEGRIHALESHLSYRIALRTFSAIESRSVIGSAAAYELPSAPGNAYLKTDTKTLVRFKAGYVSGPAPVAAPPSQAPVAESQVVPFTMTYQVPPTPAGVVVAAPPPSPHPVPEPGGPDGPTILSVLVDRLRDQGPPARQVWLPPLADSPSLDRLLPGVAPDPRRGLVASGWPGSGALRVPVGVIDRPFEQLHEMLVADLAGAAGHVGIVGAPQSGKSTLVRTLVTALALTHTPEEAQFYCLDFGGGTLATLASLPHVGAVASRLDGDRVKRTVAELSGLLERRERRFAASGVESMAAYRRLRATSSTGDPYGDVFLIIDGWFSIRQDFPDLEPAVTELAARGLGYGVHVVVAASRWSEIRPSLRDTLGTRFELRLGDPLESEIGGRLAAGVPHSPGRGLVKGGAHFLAGLPRLDGSSRTDDLAEANRALVEDIADFWPGSAAPPVRMLPAVLPVEQLPEPRGDLEVALGWDEHHLRPVVHDFGQLPHLVVYGDSETGKTNLLRLVARAVTHRYRPDEARFILGDFRRELHPSVPQEYRAGYAVSTEALAELAERAAVSMRQRLPGPEVTPDRLRQRDWWSGPRLYVLVDDYDLVANRAAGPLEPLLPLLAQGADIGLHVVIARSSSGAMRALLEPVLRRLWELGAPGLVLSYPKEEGRFLGEAVPRELPPGRAQLVTRRGIQLVQTGYVATGAGVDLPDPTNVGA
jgi:DNA segregation ATPase FtsK/SpoIIIE, S-DNA-T family